MKKLEVKQMEKIDGGKFWGSVSRCSTIYAPDVMGVMSPVGEKCCIEYYAFWIKVNSDCKNNFY